MANRIELGGFYPSQGEQSFGELRARYFVEYSNALQSKIQEVWMNNQEAYDGPKDVMAAMLNGELDEELQVDNEVNPEEYDRDEWVESQENE
ncbi:MAG: hypothetical protein ACLFUH_01210 [Bacteroidales bacterium]